MQSHAGKKERTQIDNVYLLVRHVLFIAKHAQSTFVQGSLVLNILFTAEEFCTERCGYMTKQQVSFSGWTRLVKNLSGSNLLNLNGYFTFNLLLKTLNFNKYSVKIFVQCTSTAGYKILYTTVAGQTKFCTLHCTIPTTYLDAVYIFTTAAILIQTMGVQSVFSLEKEIDC